MPRNTLINNNFCYNSLFLILQLNLFVQLNAGFKNLFSEAFKSCSEFEIGIRRNGGQYQKEIITPVLDEPVTHLHNIEAMG